MNKKLFALIFVFAAFLTGCQKATTENLFDQSVDERLSGILTSFETTLVQAPGWKLFVYPKGLENSGIEVGGLTYYVKFTDKNRVTMVSDFYPDMAETPKESGYRLKAMQRPSLIFDTYSYIHEAADPDPAVSASPTGRGGYGWGTDFNFSFAQAAPADTIKLKGNFNGSDAVLIKATAAEMNAAFGGGMSGIMYNTYIYVSSNSFLTFQSSAGGAKVGVSFDLYYYRLTFAYLSNTGELITVSVPFSHTTYGVHLKNSVTVGGYAFQDLFWDEGLGVYYFNAGGNRVNITNSATPLFPFLKAFGKLFNTISVPTTTLPGQSSLFASTYNTMKTNLKTGGYNLDLGEMNFIFDAATSEMELNIIIKRSTSTWIIGYTYHYTMSETGVAKFTRIEANVNGANSDLENAVKPILNYIEGDTFKLDYFVGSGSVLGQFTSQEHPTFYFTGNIR